MELRTSEIQEPTHIHVQRPSRSDVSLAQVIHTEPEEACWLSETASVGDAPA